jgi:hypothetical protein
MLLGGMGLLKLLQTFWGLAVLVGLGGYSLYEATQPSDSSESAPSNSESFALLQPTSIPTPHSTPMGGYPTPSPLTLFLACDGADGSSAPYYVSSAGGYVVLRLDVDRDAVVALLKGEPTRFPANATQVQTPSLRGHIRAGRLP